MKDINRMLWTLLLLLLGGAAAWAQYNPSNPSDPYMVYKVVVTATDGNYASGSGSYSLGEQVTLYTYANKSSHKFQYWTKDGEIYTTNQQFTYTVEPADVEFVAVYQFNPNNPNDPTNPNPGNDVDQGNEMGDVNKDWQIDVLDVVDIARYVVGTPAEKFSFFLADMNDDGWVNIGDAVVLVNLIVGDQNFAKPRFVSGAAADCEESLNLYDKSDNRLSLVLKNERDYTAFQFDLYMPEGTDVAEMQLNNRLTPTHQLLYNKVKDGHYRVAVLSLSNDLLSGNELLNIFVEGMGNKCVSIHNIHFFTSDGSDYRFDDILSVTSVATEIADNDHLSPHSSLLSPLYDLQGRHIANDHSPLTSHPSSLKQGVYIVNGKKVVMK